VKTYHDFLKHIVNNGEERMDRTGVGTLSTFGYQMRFNLSDSFPLVTTKRLHVRSIIYELLWFLNGDTNIKYLNDNKVTIWDEWANDDGDLGPVYGKQWRKWESKDGRIVDQISELIHNLKTNPNSRRHIVSAWNAAELPDMALPPCHLLMQFYVNNDQLSCQLYQRSADAFLGVPFNIAEYAMLTYMIAQQCDLKPREFIWTGGDVHIYLNHLDQVSEQLSRDPYPEPQLKLMRKPESIFDYQFEDFVFENYQYHPTIKAPVAV